MSPLCWSASDANAVCVRLGAEFKKGAAFGNVESVKASSSIYAPVDLKVCSWHTIPPSGVASASHVPVSLQVVDSNKKLVDEPALINKSPEKDAWLIKVRLSEQCALSPLGFDPIFPFVLE